MLVGSAPEMAERAPIDTVVDLLGVLVSAALAYMAARQLGLLGRANHSHHNVVRGAGAGYCFTCDKPLT